jgi:release factor glutamine methyltransferase
MTIAQALARAAGLGLARLDAQLLLLHALGRPQDDRAWLLAHDADALPAVATATFGAACERRAAGEPLAYIVGSKEFFGLPLKVDARVLVPRPDTETLVEWALTLLASEGLPPAPRVADLGTGSGAIALAIKARCPRAQVEAVDASADALEVARANGAALRLDVHWHQGSWFDPLAGRFDLVASNPPYVQADDPHLAALRHEPLQALAAGPDGLVDLRAIIDAAPHHLAPGGWLLLEHGWDQASSVRALLEARGFAAVQSRTDLAGIERCTGGRWLEGG